MDFKFDPFDDTLIFSACEDGKIRVFKLPAEGIIEDHSTENSIFSAHNSKISLILPHPTISKLLLSSSPENGTPTVKLWNMTNNTSVKSITIPDMVCNNLF